MLDAPVLSGVQRASNERLARSHISKRDTSAFRLVVTLRMIRAARFDVFPDTKLTWSLVEMELSESQQLES